MKTNRTIDFIIIVCFLTLTGLYILKVEWSGLLLYIFSLAVSIWFTSNEILKRNWSENRIIPVILLLLSIVLAAQALLTGANNLLAICVTTTMYIFLAERFKSISTEKNYESCS